MKTWQMIYWADANPLDYIITRPLLNDLRAEGKITDTIIIYGVNKYFVAVGRHINIDDDVNMANAAKLGVPVFRKIGGGGSGIWGPNSLQFALAFEQAFFPSIEDSLLVMAGQIMLQAIQAIGVTTAQYKHVGDIMIGSRKLGGFAALPHGKGYVNMGGFLNVEELDTTIAAAVLKTPPEKFSDKEVKDIRDYATSLQKEVGRNISRLAFIHALAGELEKNLKIKIEFVAPSEMVWENYDLYNSRYTSEMWTFSKSSSKRFGKIPEGYRLGMSRHKARKLICAHVLLDKEGKIAEVMLSGDYLIKPLDGDDIVASSLSGIPGRDFETIKKKVWQTAQAIDFDAIMMNPDDFATTIIEACQKALGNCF